MQRVPFFLRARFPRSRAACGARERSRGSVLVLTIVAFLVAVLMAALVLDGGLVYGKRAEIAKAVDAAAIAGISNLGQGQTVATQLARDMFVANYRATNLDAQPPDLSISFGVDAYGNDTINLQGTAYLRPLFLTIFPQFDVFQVHASSQATRAQLRVALALDRSGSMQSNGGCSLLPGAVDTFVDFFDDARDMFSMATFSSTATVSVPIETHFKDAVHAAIPRSCQADYNGFTYFGGGFDAALRQNESIPLNGNVSVIKVIVIFTDGLANTVQEQVVCPPPGTWNVTSGDEGNDITLIDPVSGVSVASSSNGGPIPTCTQFTNFPSIVLGVTRTVIGPTAGSDVRAEAKAWALAKSSEARLDGNIIYTIGLGSGADQAFLKQMANDPTSPSFDPTQPAGEFAYAPTAGDLQSVFEIVARKILVRLSI